MAIASLVLGIISIIFAFTGPVSFVGIIVGVVGIILGAVARKNDPSGIAIGGLVTSIIGTSMALIFYLACVACVTAGTKVIKEAAKDPQFQESFQELQKGLKELEKIEKKHQQQ